MGVMLYEETACGVRIFCDLVRMGNDYTICVYDEYAGHAGAAVMSTARPSLTGKGVSATSSVLNRLGHKDEAIARSMSEAVAIEGNCTAVCVCGIHIDGITQEQIRDITEACRRLREKVTQEIYKITKCT